MTGRASGAGSRFEQAGRLLFRWRGLVGTVGFIVVFWFGRGTLLTWSAGLPLVVAGLALRFWAMGYIGPDARAGEVGARAYVGSGPYRWFRLNPRAAAGHPLYFGNLLLVVGTLVGLFPPVLLGLAVVILFLVEYVTIARAEERHLGRSFRGVARRDVRFEADRARPEWRTVLTVAVAYGLVLARALLVGPA
ncbi:MAG: hypothetical protein R6X12_01935 [bacterium]